MAAAAEGPHAASLTLEESPNPSPSPSSGDGEGPHNSTQAPAPAAHTVAGIPASYPAPVQAPGALSGHTRPSASPDAAGAAAQDGVRGRIGGGGGSARLRLRYRDAAALARGLRRAAGAFAEEGGARVLCETGAAAALSALTGLADLHSSIAQGPHSVFPHTLEMNLCIKTGWRRNLGRDGRRTGRISSEIRM